MTIDTDAEDHLTFSHKSLINSPASAVVKELNSCSSKLVNQEHHFFSYLCTCWV